MRKIATLALVLCLGLATTGFAQNIDFNKVTLTPTIGIGMSHLKDSDVGRRFGSCNNLSKRGDVYRIGMAVGLPFDKHWSIQTGLNFIFYSNEIKAKKFEHDLKGNVSMNQTYLDLPVLGGYKFYFNRINLLLKAGPYFSCGLGGKSKYKVDGVPSVKYDTFSDKSFRRFDCGLDLEADIEVKRFVFGLEVRRGWAKVMQNYSIANSYTAVTVGYKLR